MLMTLDNLKADFTPEEQREIEIGARRIALSRAAKRSFASFNKQANSLGGEVVVKFPDHHDCTMHGKKVVCS